MTWDIRAIVMICLGVINLIVLIAGATAFVKVLNVKVQHLTEKIKVLQESVTPINEKLEQMGKVITSIIVRCAERHPRVLKAKKKK